DRGEYVQGLATGLVRLVADRVIKDPAQQIQHVIALVFSTFEALGSCYRVMRDCQQQDILVPRRVRGGEAAGDIRWRRPSEDIIRRIIPNPAYAGAFVYGRRTSDPQRPLSGRRTPATVRRPMEEWPC